MAVVVDLHELKDLSQVLRRAAPEINRVFNSEIKGAVDRHVANHARELAAFSSNIPQTIKTRRSGLTVSVSAGAGEAHPGESAAYENKGDGGSFRHPVFGNRNNWVSQRAHPFLGPSLIAGGDGVMNDVANAVERAITAVIR